MHIAQSRHSPKTTEEQVLIGLSEKIEQARDALAQLQRPPLLPRLAQAAQHICDCLRRGGKILIAGNGGSLCDAMHMAEELTGFFRRRRPALAAIALNDPGHLSCVANDLGYEWVFARSVEALGRPEDLFIGLSTSGKSVNLIHAFAAAKAKGMATLALLGKSGGALHKTADLELLIQGDLPAERIQEVHMTAMHLMIDLCEEWLFFDSYNAQNC